MVQTIKSKLLNIPSVRSYVDNRNRYKKVKVRAELYSIFKKYQNLTMIQEYKYVQNLKLVEKFKNVQGAIVECGTWKGGMIGGMATLLHNQNREYFLYDSFEGLPEAKDIDGSDAILWQNNVDSDDYLNNCSAEEEFADASMKMAQATNYTITKGWFKDTLPSFPDKKIAILRLDGDWYESTMDCLNNLFSKMTPGGVIIIDDYYTWEGCSKAIHDFFSQHKLNTRVFQFNNTICYLKIKE